jgi:predicted DNA-binding WGR domain protein
MMTRSFELTDGKSDKFWTITLEGEQYTVQFGRRGTVGQTQTKEIGSLDAARQAFDKLVAEKLKKGYKEVGAARNGAGPAAAPASPIRVAIVQAAAKASPAILPAVAKASPATIGQTPAKESPAAMVTSVAKAPPVVQPAVATPQPAPETQRAARPPALQQTAPAGLGTLSEAPPAGPQTLPEAPSARTLVLTETPAARPPTLPLTAPPLEVSKCPIRLEPADWMIATWRPRQPTPRPLPVPFDRKAATALFQRWIELGIKQHWWWPGWTQADLPASMSREEARFWFHAVLALMRVMYIEHPNAGNATDWLRKLMAEGEGCLKEIAALDLSQELPLSVASEMLGKGRPCAPVHSTVQSLSPERD